MTIKEAKEWLGKYPDDAEIYSHVVARNGRGGTFEEKLLFDGSHLEEKDGRKTVYLSYGFEIGWRNAHPEFKPPADQEAEANEESRNAILADLRQAFGELTPFATEETPFGALYDAGEHKWADLLKTCRNLYSEGAIIYVPDSVEQLKAFNTFGDLIDYLINGPSHD